MYEAPVKRVVPVILKKIEEKLEDTKVASNLLLFS